MLNISFSVKRFIQMHFKALFIHVQSPILAFANNCVPLYFGHFVVPDKVKGDLVYLITEFFRDWKNRCNENKFLEA